MSTEQWLLIGGLPAADGDGVGVTFDNRERTDRLAPININSEMAINHVILSASLAHSPTGALVQLNVGLYYSTVIYQALTVLITIDSDSNTSEDGL